MEDIDFFLNKAFNDLENQEKSYKRKISDVSNKNIKSKNEIEKTKVDETVLKLKNNFKNVITNENTYLNINNFDTNKINLKSILLKQFPNENVFDNEINDSKKFLLDKYISSLNEKQKNIKKKRNNKISLEDIKNNFSIYNISYLDFEKIHYLWNSYLNELFNFDLHSLGNTNKINKITKNYLINNHKSCLNKFLKCELTGAYLKIIESTNKLSIGIEGFIVLEKKNSFLIITKNNKLTLLLKKGNLFCFPFSIDGNFEYLKNNSNLFLNFSVYGDNFLFKAVERSKLKFKNIN